MPEQIQRAQKRLANFQMSQRVMQVETRRTQRRLYMSRANAIEAKDKWVAHRELLRSVNEAVSRASTLAGSVEGSARPALEHSHHHSQRSTSVSVDYTNDDGWDLNGTYNYQRS